MNKELQFLIYDTPRDGVKVDVVVKDETIWLTQKAMSALFDVQIPAINKHLKNIFEESELEQSATVSILEIVQTEGNRNVTRKVQNKFHFAIAGIKYRMGGELEGEE
jgi:hypothetical protein